MKTNEIKFNNLAIPKNGAKQAPIRIHNIFPFSPFAFRILLASVSLYPMPHDIFISYSSKDKEKADQLSELLASAGLSVWIDQSGIDVATSWSGEIVDAIEGCRAFVVLLSPNSIISKNVVREVALAFEKNKKILPLDLEPVALSRDLQYTLAGIQRAPMTNIDAIIRALGKLGLEATSAPTLKLVKETDSRKSLMILPFQDLSPTGDNAWFADGIVSELISALSYVKALNVTDAQTTKDFKRYQGTLPNYAKEMRIRYFVEGDVRKFGDNIKVTSRLLDIETGDHLWQDSMKGTMENIFDFQEEVALKVVDGLKVHLAADEKKKLTERGTENAEAYELFLKADEYFDRVTKEGFQLAIQLYSEAIKLDPGYANAFVSKAGALAELYRGYIRNPELLKEGMLVVTEALRLKSDLWNAYGALANILQLQGRIDEAEHAAKTYLQNAPESFRSHAGLSYFYKNTGQDLKALPYSEQAVKLNPQDLTSLWNIVIGYHGAEQSAKVRHWSEVAIPLLQRHLKLFPDDENKRVHYAALLHFARRDDEALSATLSFDNLKDGGALYNAACLQNELGCYDAGIKTFRKAMEAGYRNIYILKKFITDQETGIGKLQGTPEHEEVRELVEKIEVAAEAAKEAKVNG